MLLRRVMVTASVALSSVVCAGAAAGAEPLLIRSLSEPVALSAEHANNGRFEGLDRIGRRADSTLDLRILLIHGMGWTQDGRSPHFGTDLMLALQRSYGVAEVGFDAKQAKCAQSDKDGKPPNYPIAGIEIRPPAKGFSFYAGDSPITPFWSQGVGCVDKTTLVVPVGKITLYRLVWDDSFYNAYTYPLVGYDDSIRTAHEQPDPPLYSGYEDLTRYRRSGTASIRDNVLTYGIADAALYMGPVGYLMRSAVRGAICAVANDITGRSDEFTPLMASATLSTAAVVSRSEEDLCRVENPQATTAPLAIVAESLGSRMVFDVLSRDRDDVLAKKLNELPGPLLEVYLLANQIPLIAAARLQPWSPNDVLLKPPAGINKTIRYVAFSERDDLLSWELVPYFEHLYYMSCRNPTETTRAQFGAPCTAGGPKQALLRFKATSKARLEYVNALGFEVIDVRATFSPPISVFLRDYANPQEAHTGYMRSDQVRRAVLCGAFEGKTNPACATR